MIKHVEWIARAVDFGFVPPKDRRISGASVRSARDTKLTAVNTNSHPNRQAKLASAKKADAVWANRLDASASSSDAT